MRLWSIHPKYLDSRGLVALWREALLAKKALAGKTKGYKKHPQLERFRNRASIDEYLSEVFKESCRRGFCFDKKKIGKKKGIKVFVSKGQIDFELSHLKKKLKMRDRQKLREISNVKSALPNPVFSLRKGGVESWEKLP